MPQILSRVTVPANGRTDIVTGTPHEFPGPAKITVAAVTEGAAGSGQVSVFAGTRTILENGNLTLAAAAGNNPLIPDNVVASGVVRPGERLRVPLINTTGAAVVMTGLVDIS